MKSNQSNQANGPVIFISWSGSQSREYAKLIQDFLLEVYRLKYKDVFISRDDLHTNEDTLFNEIIDKSISADICISCITKTNQLAPWISFEAGLFMVCKARRGSKSRIPLLKKEVPVILDFYLSDLDKKMTMFTQRNAVHSEHRIGKTIYYSDILKRLLVEIDTFVSDCINDEDYRIIPLNIRNPDDEKLAKGVFKKIIDLYSRKMMTCHQKYDSHDIYISRPIKGVPEETCNELTMIIEDVIRQAQERKVNVYSSSGNAQFGNLFQSRFDILRKSKHFLLIYPKITDKSLPPSSCFMELGAAIALGNGRISILYHENAQLPEFLNQIADGNNKTNIKMQTYNDASPLTEIILGMIN
jgi:hypothetical protein